MTRSLPAALFRTVYRLFTLLKPNRGSSFSNAAQSLVFTGNESTASVSQTAKPPIPRKIWTYWNAETPDAMVRQCIANWATQCPGFTVHVLNSRNLTEWIPEQDLPTHFATLHPTKQSDWVRLYVVRHHGGYWLDATILLTQPLSWLDSARGGISAEFAGFYLEGYTHDAHFPVIESWAFGAPAHSSFVSAWQDEFNQALILQGTDQYLQEIQATTEGETLLQGIADPAYLLIHVAAQRVLRRTNAYRLALFKAEDTAFFYQKAVRWKWYLLYPRLCLVPADAQIAPLVKLRGGERRHFAQLFAQHGEPAADSLWGRACRPAAPR
ncbi:capsular polysaccharide synthesis protein [Paracidovorax wautersii]|uniref:Capsular polysaccharide synthesis protein n=1 Tax=Paracidovorax wautersii TaxID=1177982 RepID=A0ABU1I962_9BURK|nr:capsular polysaccharide synthesis protein [Paracidovorax wautersii]MDR6213362.1 hypothetical protein [Paracidovorax wautersii]